MYVNETIFTPLYRYMIWCIEKDESKELEQSCEEIRAFLDNHTKKSIDGVYEDISIIDAGKSILEKTIRLLEMASCGKEQMHSFWEKECNTIENESCGQCIFCKKCRSYFWGELGEIFFDETNIMKESGSYLPIRKIPKQIEKHLVPSKKAADLYYYNNYRRRAKITDGCIILKGMSSSTPSLMNSIYDTNQFSGGGFFLRYNGIGVAIDPGYHFLNNLHHYGLSVMDINAVIITHEHIDHNNDMRLLDDLHYAVYKYEQDEEKQKIHWYLDKVSYEVAKLYQKNATGFNAAANVLYCVSPEVGGIKCGSEVVKDIILGKDTKFRFKCFPTRHIEEKRKTKKSDFKEHTFGCQFKLGDGVEEKCLVYTSDTRYFPEIINYIDMPDILIANISGVYEDDFMLIKPKERHLGYYGCYFLLKDIYKHFSKLPDLVMISEFWNGENDIRYDVSSFLEKQIKKECGEKSVRIIPAEVGMVFKVTDSSVRCSQCGKYTKQFVVRKPNGYKEKIRVYCDSCFY